MCYEINTDGMSELLNFAPVAIFSCLNHILVLLRIFSIRTIISAYYIILLLIIPTE